MSVDEKQTDDYGKVSCYAIRRVNPFLGVLQVIENTAGRAISSNGIVWDIEVRAEHSDEWGSLSKRSKQLIFYRYGLWSLQDGLVNRPLAPHLEKDPLTHKCNSLIECIKQRITMLPFDLEDTHELWLFDDKDQRPIALLASKTPESDTLKPEPKYWASHLGADGVPSQVKFPQAKALSDQVCQVAGFNIKTHWIDRQKDGGGIIIDKGTQLAKEALPAFLITDDWPEEEQQNRITSYFSWIAPSLLTLQCLHPDVRLQLENKLYVQAISIEHHYNLYPQVIDETRLKSALVQCRLQKSNQ